MIGRLVLAGIFLMGYVLVNSAGLPFIGDGGPDAEELDRYEVSIDDLRSSPDRYLNQTVIVEGVPDIALVKEDTFMVHTFLNRSDRVYVRGCEEEFDITDDRVYVKGEFRNMTEEAFLSGENMTQEERRDLKRAEEAMEKYNYSTSAFESSSFYGIRCEKVM